VAIPQDSWYPQGIATGASALAMTQYFETSRGRHSSIGQNFLKNNINLDNFV
jgi:hypothetical protein